RSAQSFRSRRRSAGRAGALPGADRRRRRAVLLRGAKGSGEGQTPVTVVGGEGAIAAAVAQRAAEGRRRAASAAGPRPPLPRKRPHEGGRSARPDYGRLRQIRSTNRSTS